MLYTAYKNGILYNSQSTISFPKTGDRTLGNGAMIFLLSPNREKALKFIEDDSMWFKSSLYKRYITDTVYKTRIGVRYINLLEKSSTDKEFSRKSGFPLEYVNSASRKSVIDKGYNIVDDLSRWMELFFNNSYNLNPMKKCEEFVKLLTDQFDNVDYKAYNEKVVILDIDAWVSSAKSCVIMNPKLLTNPLSILLFTAIKYPEMLEKVPNMRFMIIGRTSNQVILYNLSDLNKKNYTNIKSRLSRFKNVVFSSEDIVDVDTAVKEEELKATRIAEMRSRIFNTAKFALTGDVSFNPLVDEDDVTSDVSDDIGDNLTTEDINPELDGEINSLIDQEMDYIDDTNEVDVDEMVNRVVSIVKQQKFTSSFIPVRTPEQLEKIKRLTEGQEKALNRATLSDANRKSIGSSSLGKDLSIINPNLQMSKYVNFDKDYTDKCLERNIDDAVAILSQTDNKIFITDKEVTDNSNSMDIKKTYTYSLVDEKGNKMTVKLDIPTIIKDNYVYINGTQKNINHQFMLKPIVKTGPDTVQIVTAYNKVFIRRLGAVTQNMNKLSSFLSKNKESYKAVPGVCYLLNKDYDLPIDYIMLSKAFLSFKIDNRLFNLQIDKNIEMYKKLTGKELQFDKNKMFPIGINLDTKKPIYLNINSSYTEYIYNQFSDSAKKAITSIKRKPRLVVATAKMMQANIPIIAFLLYCDGFAKTMEKAKIEYRILTSEEFKKEKNTIDTFLYDIIAIKDAYIIWKKTPFRNELLMNGLKKLDLTSFAVEDLESKDTYISMMMAIVPGNRKLHFAMDNYRDFLLDTKTKEILTDFGYPTDVCSLFIVAAGMLSDNEYLIENSLHNMRIRSNEVIADLVYMEITRAYTAYRNTAYKKKPTKLSIKQSAIVDKLLSSDTNMIEETSVSNPILEAEKRRAVTFKGVRGIQMERAMTLPRRSYDKSMLGTIGITTSPDANVGVVRQITMEPNITSTYGYIDANKADDLDGLSSTNLFTIGELVNPFGITHDDPDRTAMDA